MNLIFDLDGTIIDSSQGIYEAYRLSIKKFAEPVSMKIFSSCIGPPISDLLCEIHPNLSEKDTKTTSLIFRENYDNEYFLKFIPYKNIEKTINTLANKYALFLLTNKPTKPAISIIKKMSLQKFFKGIVGIDFFKKKGINKTINLSKLINHYSLQRVSSIYIGDTISDFVASKENGIKFIAHTKGFYSWNKSELELLDYKYSNVINLEKLVSSI